MHVGILSHHDTRPDGGVQRWCHCYLDHDYGCWSSRCRRGRGRAALRPLVPVLCTYVLSFVYLGIYWNNHHHMLHAADRVSGKVLCGEPAPALLVVARAICHRVGRSQPVGCASDGGLRHGVPCPPLRTPSDRRRSSITRESIPVAVAVGNDTKGKLSMLLYASAIRLRFGINGSRTRCMCGSR